MRFQWMTISVILVAMTAAVSIGFAEKPAPFSVEVEEVRNSVLLGLPVVLALKIRNTSAMEQNYPKFSATLRLDVLEAPAEAERWLKADERVGKDGRLSYTDERTSVSADWITTTKRGFLPPVAGEYQVRVALRFRETGRREALCGESSDHWVGEVLTRLVKVEVHLPVGLDAQTFAAISALAPKDRGSFSTADRYQKAFWPGTTDAMDLLLGEFLESAYTAHKIFTVFVSDHPVGTNDVFVESYRRQASPGGLMRTGGETWCDSAVQPRTIREEWIRLRGKDFIRCRDNWLQIALQHHPDAWFADEIRMKLAVDHYLLGEKEECDELLTGLTKSTRPLVAEKAKDLLKAMKNNGMLEGGSPAEEGVGAANTE
ncbi:MAG: hypothetical protein K8R59_05985 [Thermoanaerobaculales bacterium]|nr:hypothetical protein [Thermoanaerobaculales bacterium]